MNRKILIAFGSLILSLLPSAAFAQGSLVVNGGFDTSATGWSSSNINVAGGAGYRSTKGDPGGFFMLGGASQTIPSTVGQTIYGLTPGNTYMISGDYMGLAQPSQSSGFGVAINGNDLFEGSTSPLWTSFNVSFTANSSSAALMFATQFNGTLGAFGIDNIAVTPTPEPSTLWLGSDGAGVLVLHLRMRRKKGRST